MCQHFKISTFQHLPYYTFPYFKISTLQHFNIPLTIHISTFQDVHEPYISTFQCWFQDSTLKIPNLMTILSPLPLLLTPLGETRKPCLNTWLRELEWWFARRSRHLWDSRYLRWGKLYKGRKYTRALYIRRLYTFIYTGKLYRCPIYGALIYGPQIGAFYIGALYTEPLFIGAVYLGTRYIGCCIQAPYL